ncbi:N-acetyl-gamma-glutamyl-phosphate reductase [Salirhabdus euzebyi]|uniref:N-acetyl-gamma-glutamyl-phosphate reductase n=1 Tax=Salirhabdus euzebyi TaxID=394506 RepID=A0A841Q5T3_9BACI|nr:N-acetyl-gamma-glutamyl-phosphate reductase [Salirhabdus euzebyi]MBB6453758.1 N-acetyl-gamma-glutamyl-phosphate reductase [Salirhabdus euzebyi]
MQKVCIVGANGYSGVELIRLINQHPFLSLELIVSHSNSGKVITDLYPHLSEIVEENLEVFDTNEIAEKVDIVFFATPAGVSMDYLPALVELGIKCVDLSGDFRLRSSQLYKDWYKKIHTNESYLQQSTYGLTEVNKEQIKNASFIANPGCYATAGLLGLIPMMHTGLINYESIIIDGKSGVSGAGRNPSISSHFAEVNENVKAYKLGAHQHIPEIEQILLDHCEIPIKLTFSTHLIPMTRGILCTIYVDLIKKISTNEILDIYRSFYKNAPFVRLRQEGTWPSTKEVLGSNFCDLGFFVDERTNRLTIISVIDNVMKGASGQAIQNVNILNGWEETTGLSFTPVYP